MMNKWIKWLVGGVAIFLLAGLAVFYGRMFFSSRIHPVLSIPIDLGRHVVTISSDFRLPGGELTPEELRIKQHLQELLQSGQATHRLVYDESKTMTGRLLEEHPDYIVFSQEFGHSGSMSVQLPRSRIVRIDSCNSGASEISRRDIRFHMEFPDKQFYKSSPYTIISEESFFAVEHIIKMLQELYAGISDQFGSLISSSVRRDDIQLLVFSDAQEYESFRRRYATELQGSSGFYSHGMDRMVVYHQRDSDWVKDGEKQIAEVSKKYENQKLSGQARQSLERWKSSARGQLLDDANKMTDSVIRHEGAHQLLFTLGIQNQQQNGRSWLTEGLATYCETTKPGRLNGSRIDELSTALSGGKLISLRTLMTMSFNGNSLAYAEAWSLTYMLMQPEYRSGFFAWIDWLRQNPRTSARDPEEELCRFLSIPIAELESRWNTCVTGLVQRRQSLR